LIQGRAEARHFGRILVQEVDQLEMVNATAIDWEAVQDGFEMDSPAE
jgi:hypothetical protein